MKRRKWWVIGLSVALLAACVGVWKWSASRPFSFLSGSRVTMMGVFGDPVFQGENFAVGYILPEPLAQVMKRAEVELRPSNGWEPAHAVRDEFHFRKGKQWVSIRHEMKPDARTGLFVDAPGKSAVIVSSPLTSTDRFRSAIFRFLGI